MRPWTTVAFASVVVVTACSDDGVPLDEGSTSSAEETSEDDADTITSTITLDSTDTSPSTTAPSGTSGDTSGDSVSTLGETTDPSSATAEGESTTVTTDAESSSSDPATTTPDETSSTGGPSTTNESSSSDAESESSGGNAPLCGDGLVQGNETCDGDDLGENESCVDLGYSAGVLACNPGSCQYDESDCNDESAYAIDFCRLQFPTSFMGNAGGSLDVFGRVYVGGLTDQSQFNDPAANVVMQVGYGDDGGDPQDDESWAWFPGGPNAGYGPGSPGFEMNNDEYTGSMILPPAGEYDFAVRFSGDGGATWTVCDGGDAGSSNGYAPADAGQLSTM